MTHVFRTLQQLLIPVVLLALWWALSDSSTSLYFPPLREIMTEFRDIWLFSEFTSVLMPTLRTFMVGYAISVILGVVLGLFLSAKPFVAEFIGPLMEFLRALPAIALVPVFMSVLGVGENMRLSIVVFASVWPVLLNTVDGVRGLDSVAKDTSISFRLPFWQKLLFVTLPGASPQIMAGARVALSLSLIAVIVTEMVSPASGVGAFAKSAQMRFDMSAMWSAVLLMGIVGYLLNNAFIVLEKRILKWHKQMQSTGKS